MALASRWRIARPCGVGGAAAALRAQDGGSDARPLRCQVYYPNGTKLHEQPFAQGSHYGFSAREGGDYKACFTGKPAGAAGGDAAAAGVTPSPAVDGGTPAFGLAGASGDPAAAAAALDGVTAQGDPAVVPSPPPPPPPSPPPSPPAEAGGVAAEAPQVLVRVEWVTGVGARDWAAVAKRDHLRDVTTSLTELEEELKGVFKEMLDMRSREEKMRDLSERVNAKVAWLSVLSLTVSCLLAVWQLAHMKAYFIKKKLL